MPMSGRCRFEDARVTPLDLHYSRGKLIRLALLSLAGTAVSLWLATGGIAAGAEGRGPGARIGRLLGPDGVQALGWVLAAVTAALALLYLRRAFADPIAARADAEGVTINTLFGSHLYAADDLDGLELRHSAGQPILQVIPAAGRGKMRGLAVNGLVEGEEEVEAWIGAVNAAFEGRGGASPPAEIRISGTTGWTCLGEGEAHAVEREWLETLTEGGSTTRTVERCRRCSCLYLHVHYEISDWGPSGDYSDETYSWVPLAPDELDAARADFNYAPRAATCYRYDTGWKAG